MGKVGKWSVSRKLEVLGKIQRMLSNRKSVLPVLHWITKSLLVEVFYFVNHVLLSKMHLVLLK